MSILSNNGGRRFDLLAFGDPNADYVFEAKVIPGPDQKVLGRNLGLFPGGTAANVACAASRLEQLQQKWEPVLRPELRENNGLEHVGAPEFAEHALGGRVASFSRVGSDAAGAVLLADFAAFGVATDHVETVAHPSAAAMIMVDAAGEKALIYAPMPGDPLDRDRFAKAAAMSRVVYAMPYDLNEFRLLADIAHQQRADVAIDIEAAVAPDPERLEALLELSDIVFMNEGGFRATQAGEITAETVRPLLDRGPRVVIVTLAEKGALAVTRDEAVRQAAYPARLIDATGAGDCFNGAFLAASFAGQTLKDSLAFAAAAASLAVEAVGARSGIPTVDAVMARISAAI